MDWFELNNALDLLWEKQQKSNLELKVSIAELIKRFDNMDMICQKLYDKIEKIK